MDSNRLLEILRITVPVFIMMGIGNLLSRTGKMTEEHQSFLNWLVYYICLPVLIFTGLVGQPFRSLFNTDLIFGTLLALLAVFLIFAIGTFLFRVDGKFAVVMIYSAYWANVAYMGFPLSASAFGEKGLTDAAIVNAISMPVFVVIAFFMISFYSEKRPNSFLTPLKDALVNPIILASVIGLIAAFIADAFLLSEESRVLSPAITNTFAISKSILEMTGTMGLPLALIAVGGKLRFRSLGKNKTELFLVVFGKLILLPLLTLIIIRTLFPSAQKEVTGAAVLLMATPAAVAASIVTAKFRLNDQFTSSVLAVSTVFSVITIPFWLYIVL